MYREAANTAGYRNPPNLDKGSGQRSYYPSDPSLDLQNPSSIFRENLRVRVRENERRLGPLVRPRGDHYKDIGLDEYKSEDWDRESYSRARLKDGKSDFLYDKLSGIEEGFAQQARRIKTLESDLCDRDDEIKLLRSELLKKLGKIVELEFELKASIPAFDEDLVSLGGDQLYDIDLNDSVRGTDSRSTELKRAKMMVTKLMTDLRNLESRYKEEQLKAARVIEELRLQNEDLRDSKMTKVMETEKRVREVEEECARLEKSAELKDRQIDNLKKELTNLRLNKLAGQGDYFDREYSDFDRNLLRGLPTVERSRDEPRPLLYSEYDRENSRAIPSTRESPSRSIRFDDEVDEPLARTKEAQMALIQQSRMRAGSFENTESPSQILTEEDIFPTNNASRGNSTESSSPRSSNLASRSASVRAVKQDQEQAVQRAKKTGLFGRRRLFGRS